MIESKINELREQKTKYEDKEKEVFGLCDSVLKKIYNLQTEYNKKNRRGLYLIEQDFDRFKTDACEIKYLSNGFPVEINYYDLDYDCYDSAKIRLPQEVFESDDKLQEWFDSKVSEYEERINEAKRIKGNEEYKNYLKLKEKYEKDTE
jgi:hypothetical protein